MERRISFLAILCQFITPNEYRMSVSVSDNKRTVWFDNALKKEKFFGQSHCI